MYKNLNINRIRFLFISFLLFILFNSKINGQQSYPYTALQAEYGTGRIASLSNFGRFDNTIKAGTGFLNTFRSWAIFNTTVIPSNSYIEKVTLTYYVQKGSDDSNHKLEIKKLTDDPRTTDGWSLWVAIGASSAYGYTDNNTYTGWKGPIVVPGANTDFQTQLQNGSGWFAFAFKEYNDDDDACEIKGWEDTNYQPCIKVTFSLLAPSNVSATDNDCDKVRVTWNSVNNANRYYVYCDNELLGYTTNTYYDYDNASTTSKQYKVYAGAYWGTYSALRGDHSSYSGSDYGKKLDCSCDTPTGLTATNITSSSAYIDWGYVSGSISYDLYFRKSGTSAWSDRHPSSSNYSLTGLECSTTYEYQVRTNCGSGNYSSWVAGSDFTTSACSCNDPSSLSVSSITDNSAYLDWGLVSGNSGYEVRYKPTTSSTWTNRTSNTSSYTASGLDCGTTYDWQVRTYCGGSNYSSWVAGSDFTTSACSCNDPLEPNNSYSQAYNIGSSANYTNNNLCLTAGDEDWFKFTYETSTYYFQVTGFSSSTTGAYGISFSISGSSVTIETVSSGGSTTDTKLFLYDTDHSTELSSNDDYSGFFSKIIYISLSIDGEDVSYSELIKVFPNPVRDLLHIDLSSISHQVTAIEVINMNGKVIYAIQDISEIITLNVSNFSAGLYLVKIYTKEKVLINKFSID